MSRVLIIGAGGVGRVVTHKCAQLPEVFSDIWLASRTKSKCDQIAAEVGGDKVKTAQVDADSVPELLELTMDVVPELEIACGLCVGNWVPVSISVVSAKATLLISTRLPQKSVMRKS